MQRKLLFLSHAGVDSEDALKLAQQIQTSPAAIEAGLDVWVDRKDLQPGKPWQDQLEDAIGQRSTAFAVYISGSGAKHWMRMEVRAALDRAIAEERCGRSYPFIPILDDAHVSLPPFARQYQGVSRADPGWLQQLISAVLGTTDGIRLVDEPFVGLESFGADQAHLYFGREREAAELLERLRSFGLVVVVGDSGSGKSSLVRAGVATAFREGRLADPMGPRPAPNSWHVLEMRPLNTPIDSLIKAASDAARDVVDLRGELFEQACRRLRRREPGALADVLRECAPVDAKVLLVVDQFEELWTQTRDEALRMDFLDGVLHAVEPSDRRVRVVATIRRDHYFQTKRHEGLTRLLEAGDGRPARYNLRRMLPEQLRSCIEKPLALAGVTASDVHAMAEEILRDAGDEPGELALVEMALHKAWRERQHHDGNLLQAYKAIGRVEGALGQAAEESLRKVKGAFGAEGVRLAEAIFVRLATQSAEWGVTRRRAVRSEFDKGAWEVAQILGSREFNRLLVLSQQGDDRVSTEPPNAAREEHFASGVLDGRAVEVGAGLSVELAHEQIATQWSQCLQWLRGTAARVDDKQSLDRLIPRVQDWLGAGRRSADVSASRTERAGFARLAHRQPHWLSPDERVYLRRLEMKARVPVIIGVLAASALVVLAGAVIIDQRSRLIQADAREIWNQVALGEPLTGQRAILKLKSASVATREEFLAQMRTDSTLARFFVESKNQLALIQALAGESGAQRLRLIELAISDSQSNVQPDVQRALAVLVAKLDAPRAIEPLLKAIASTNDFDGSMQILSNDLIAVVDELDTHQAEHTKEKMLQEIAGGKNQYRLRALAEGLSAVAAKLDAHQTERMVDELLRAIIGENNSFRLEALSQGMRAVAAKLDTRQAQRTVDKLLKAIAEQKSRERLEALSDGLVAMVVKLDALQAKLVLEEVLKAVAGEENKNRLDALSKCREAVAAKLDAKQVKRAEEDLLKQVPAIFGTSVLTPPPLPSSQQSSDQYKLQRLSQRSVADAVKPAAQQAIDELLKLIVGNNTPERQRELSINLAAVADKLDAQQAERAFQPLVEGIAVTAKLSNENIQMNLSQALATVAVKLDAQRAGHVVDQLLKEFDLGTVNADPQARWKTNRLSGTSDSEVAQALAQGLVTVVVKLNAQQARDTTEILLNKIDATVDSDFLRALLLGLAAVPGKLDPTQAERTLDQSLKEIAASNMEYQLVKLSEGLEAFSAKLEARQAERTIDTLLKKIATTNDESALQSLARCLAAVAIRSDPLQGAKAVRAALENPFLDSESTKPLIEYVRKHPPAGLTAKAGIWDIRAWQPR